jgi:hypothetical protein
MGGSGSGAAHGRWFFENCWAALNVFIRCGSGWGSEIKRCFWGVEMNPSVRPDDRDDGDEERSGNGTEGSGGMYADLGDFFDALNTPKMQIERLRTSVELFFDDVRRGLDPRENGELPIHGTESGTLGAYLRDANDAEDLRDRSLLVWSVFNEAFESAPDVAINGHILANHFANSIIQHLAVSLVTIECSEGLKRFDLEAGVNIGEFLRNVNDQGVRLEFIPGDGRLHPDDRELESAYIRRNLKSSGERMLGALVAEYQKYEADARNLLDDALTNDLLDKYLPSNIYLSDEAFENLKEFCIQECGSLYERDLSESLQRRINQVFDALINVGAIKEGEMLFPQPPE